MKRNLLFVTLLIGASSFAQTCNELFISEYVEGTWNNKALEIYNPTANTIDLTQYFVARYSNGATTITAANCVQLTGTIAPYSTHVGVVDKRDPNGTGQETPIWDELEAIADAFYCPDYDVSNAWYWNGNDCIMLAKGSAANPTAPTTVLVDFFGKVGQNPENTTLGTNGWSSVSPYDMSAAEGGNAMDRVVTENHSMIRKSTVLIGKNSVAEIFGPTYTFDPLLQYDSIPAVIPKTDPITGDIIYQSDGVTPQWVGNWASLGTHNCDCAPASVEVVDLSQVKMYPNPSEGTFFVSGAEAVKEIVVINGLGQEIKRVKNAASQVLTIDLSGRSGIYIVKFIGVDGKVSTKRLIVQK